ncbi:hypothetical protein QC764_122900 [Podospora pseudoanserina]|uniref:Bromo domain-containing protein n=1 Tax=Podospora pseudoanserina TaxID=2609844 RepID=A0ABR0IS04_9PEZI|nr:hypothetical protein QC764_122900 [Podospora pseudoanserina]
MFEVMEEPTDNRMAEEPVPQPNGDAVAVAAEVVTIVEAADKNASDVAPVEVARPANSIQEHRPFSWLEPHPIFVIALVGPEEIPFGIQKDFLCSKSSYYRKFFDENADQESIENIVRLPETPTEVFAYCQNYLYTGQVFPSLDNLPSYDVLIGVWKLGHMLGIDGLCDATLDAMIECRRITEHIPATPLLVQVWKDTPEGSSIRKLLLSWAAEYMRSSESRTEFARSLPQEVLSELVVAMSSLENSSPLDERAGSDPAALAPAAEKRRDAEGGQEGGRPAKKQRVSEAGANGSPPVVSQTASGRKTVTKGATASVPKASSKPGPKRRTSGAAIASQQFSTNQKLNFCADLLARMLSGPGFWTRVVGPFKDPVDPQRDGVPDYFNVVKKPMDLTTMKNKMDNKEYSDEQEFLADMNQIFANCYEYWNETDPMWGAAEKLQKSFEDKFSQMNKWIAKMEGDEGH